MAHYLGNKSASKKEVHDLYNQKRNCQISEIRDKAYFVPDTLEQADKEGYSHSFLISSIDGTDRLPISCL